MSNKSYIVGGVCRRGHLLTEAILYVRPSDRTKECKLCRARQGKDYRTSHKPRIKLQQATWYKNNVGRKQKTARKSHLKLSFGITPEQYATLADKQQHQCAICERDTTEASIWTDVSGRTPTSLYVDHDHKTGAIRGLLCYNCNFALGHFKDSIERLQKAINYLKEYQHDNAEAEAGEE